MFAYEMERFNNDYFDAQTQYKETLANKDQEIKKAVEKITLLESESKNIKSNYENKNSEIEAASEHLRNNLNELVIYKNKNEVLVSKLTSERDDALTKLEEITNLQKKQDEYLQETRTEVRRLHKQLEELETEKRQEIEQLKEKLDSAMHKSNSEIGVLKSMLDEKSQLREKQILDSENLGQEIMELNKLIIEKDKNITESNSKHNEIYSRLEKLKIEYENDKKDARYEITILQNKLQNVTESKDEIINNLKSMISEKDSQVISLSCESTKLSEEVARLTELLEESQAELEIGQNELFTLKEEHETIEERNETNVSMKNAELRSLLDEIKALKQAKWDLENERDKNNNEHVSEKQVCKLRV